MTSKKHPYLTITSNHIWYFQRWIPKHVAPSSNCSPIVRFSLRTKSHSLALRSARVLTLKIEQLAEEHFGSPDAFGKAMKLLLKEYQARVKAGGDHDAYEHLMADIDEDRQEFLDAGIKLRNFVANGFNDLERKNDASESRLNTALDIMGNQATTIANQKINQALANTYSDGENPTLQKCLDLWIEDQSRNPPTSFEMTIHPIVDLFVRYITDDYKHLIRVNDLGNMQIRNYHEFITSLPKNTTTKGIPIARLKRLELPANNSKSAKTLKDNHSHVVTFLNWLAGRGYPLNIGVTSVLRNVNKSGKRQPSQAQRVPLSNEDLTALFMSDEYLRTGKFKTSAMYWAPLIALFTGARMTEIVQLESTDIKKLDKVDVISFNGQSSTGATKRVKAAGSYRDTPIHPQLVSLGFLEFVATKSGRLFDDEPLNARGKYDAFQKRQTTYRKSKGVAPKGDLERRDFHSFRHTVRTRLSELKNSSNSSEWFDEGVIDSIVGHSSSSRSVGEKTYTHSQLLESKYNAIKQLQYDCIDFTKLLSWEKCTFNRNRRNKP